MDIKKEALTELGYDPKYIIHQCWLCDQNHCCGRLNSCWIKWPGGRCEGWPGDIDEEGKEESPYWIIVKGDYNSYQDLYALIQEII
ncbi:MAG: hypothetical protein SVO01_00250, partial [Thermotogota bacterium]|nr:hypothetical protein [Thermotogota bacterium]